MPQEHDDAWHYAKRDCPNCQSDNTWTNGDEFRCDDCDEVYES